MRLQEAPSNRTPACTDRQTAEPPPSPTPNGVEPTCRQTKPLAGPHTPDTLPKGAYDVIIVGAGQPSAVGGCCRYRRRRCLLPAVPAAAHPPRMPSLPRLLAALIPRPLRLRGGLLPGQGRRPCGPAGQGAMTMGSCHYRRVPGHAGSSGLHHTGRACVCNRQQLSICHLLPLVALFTTRMGPAGAKQAHPAVCPPPCLPQEHFPRDKICGDAVCTPAIHILEASASQGGGLCRPPMLAGQDETTLLAAAAAQAPGQHVTAAA